MDAKAQDDCQRHKCKVHQKVEQLQHQRQQQLAPSRLYLPPPWQPAVFKQPTPQFMVLAAEGCSFVALHDSRLKLDVRPRRLQGGLAAAVGLHAHLHDSSTGHGCSVFPARQQQCKGC